MISKPTVGIKAKSWFKLTNRFIHYVQLIIIFLISYDAAAVTKVSVSSGNWNNPSCWEPTGKPTANDDVTIAVNHILTLKND